MATATWQDVLVAELTDERASMLADLAIASIEREMPFLHEDAGLRELARTGTLANLRLVADISAGVVALRDAAPPPQAIAFARELARRNVPMTELARAYRVVQHEMWRFGAQQIRNRIPDGDEAAAEIEHLTDATFATGEVLMGASLECYTTERDRWVRSADAIRRETVEAILAGEGVDVAAASARLRYDLRRDHIGFVVWTAGEEHESPAAASGALLVPIGAGLIAGWCHPDALDLTSWPRVAIGEPGRGIDGFRATHRQASEAARVARLSGMTGAVRYTDVALTALLTKDLDQARAFAARELGALAEADTRIADTVLAVLDAQGSPRRAAQRLGVHENTVAKRIKTAEALLGRGVYDRPAELFAALTIARASR
jgi:hypothetical protein